MTYKILDHQFPSIGITLDSNVHCIEIGRDKRKGKRQIKQFLKDNRMHERYAEIMAENAYIHKETPSLIFSEGNIEFYYRFYTQTSSPYQIFLRGINEATEIIEKHENLLFLIEEFQRAGTPLEVEEKMDEHGNITIEINDSDLIVAGGITALIRSKGKNNLCQLLQKISSDDIIRKSTSMKREIEVRDPEVLEIIFRDYCSNHYPIFGPGSSTHH